MTPTFFANQAHFRKWLAKNHMTETELLVGFYKVGSGRPSMSWPESVDQALCFGGLVDNCRDVGAYLEEGLRKLAQKYDCIGDVRGMGMKLGVEFVTDKSEPDARTRTPRRSQNGLLQTRPYHPRLRPKHDPLVATAHSGKGTRRC